MNRTAILAVFALFLVPVLLATLMHSQWLDWQPAGGRNHGDLIQPVIEMDDFAIHDARGQPVTRADLLDRWQLVHVDSRPCDEACLENLYWLRQVRRAQDRHQPDIGLVFISNHDQDEATIEAIAALADDLLVLTGAPAAEVLDQFPQDGREGGFYIIDPMANIILQYPADTDHNGIRRDLRRLLTWTQRD